jgi:hypothetical protein
MTVETRDKILRPVLTVLCFTVYLSLVAAMAADAYNTNVYNFLFG